MKNRFAIAALCLLGSLVQAAPLEVTLSKDPTTCSPMTVSWDASSGTGPWTVTVAPLGHVPISVALPKDYLSGSAWTWSWDIPGYASAVSRVIVAVSDSTGRVTGTSAFSKLTKAGSCSAPSEQLDFIWYPPKADPKQCDDWTFTVQEDRNNLGLKLPADILILPENAEPTRLRISEDDKNKVDWKVNYPHGTKFAVTAFDAGKSGTGGVGSDVYSVSKGKSTSCLDSTQKEAVAGLRDATSTANAVVQTSTSTASRMATSRTSAVSASTNTAKDSSHTPSAVSDSASDSATKVSSVAKIGGAIGGFVGALAIAGAILLVYRRRKNRGPDEYGVYPQSEKRSFFGGFGSKSDGFAGINGLRAGRFGASAGTQGGISPFTAGRMSHGRWSTRPYESMYDEKGDVAPQADAGSHAHGHSSSVSLHRSSDSLGRAGPVLTSASGLYGSQNEFSMITGSATFQTDRPREVVGVGAFSGPTMVRDGSQMSSVSNPFSSRMQAPRLPDVFPQWHQGQQQQEQQAYSQHLSHHPASRISAVDLAQPSLPPSSAAFPVRGMSNGPVSRDLLSNLPSTNQYARDPFADAPGRQVAQSSFNQHAPFAGHPAQRPFYNGQSTGPPSLNHPNRSVMAPPANHVPRYVDPKESAARFRSLDTQLLQDRNKVLPTPMDDLSDDEEGGLPYM